MWVISVPGCASLVAPPEFRFGITGNRRFSGSCDVIATARGSWPWASSFLCCWPGSYSCKDKKNLFFLNDSTGNPRSTVSGRVCHLVVRARMDDQ